MSAYRLPSEPCARYSKAQLLAFAARKLDELRQLASAGGIDEYLRGEHAPDR